MTTTLDRPAVPRVTTRRAAPRRGALGPGLVAAAWALGAGLVSIGIPVLLVWAADSRSGSGAAAAARAVGQVWLLAHGTSLDVPGGVVGLTPLGLTLLPLALLHRAGRHAARQPGAVPVKVVLATAFPYALAAPLVAAMSATAQIRPAPVQAITGAFLVALLGVGSAVLREGGVAVANLPARLRRVVGGTGVAVAGLLAAGSLLAGAALLTHFQRASLLAGASDPGFLGGVALVLLGLVCVPNAAVWGASWLTGPGFAVGVGTAVSPFETSLGAVPAMPLLAALPNAAAPTWLGVAALLVPMAAGALGGMVVARQLTSGPGTAALEALALGPCAGALMCGLAYLSGGPLGDARLADVGPSPWQVGLAVMLEVGAGAAAAAAAVRRNR